MSNVFDEKVGVNYPCVLPENMTKLRHFHVSQGQKIGRSIAFTDKELSHGPYVRSHILGSLGSWETSGRQANKKNKPQSERNRQPQKQKRVVLTNLNLGNTLIGQRQKTETKNVKRYRKEAWYQLKLPKSTPSSLRHHIRQDVA